MPSTKWLLALALGAAVLAFAACGGDDDDDDNGDSAGNTPAAARSPASTATEGPQAQPPQGSGGEGPCELITSGEAGTALGGTVGAPQKSAIGEGFSQCIYQVQGADPGDKTLVIQSRGNTSRDDFDRLVDENTPEQLGEPQPVSGLGDVAFYQVATFALEGDTMVVVTIIGAASGDDEAAQTELMRTALGRVD
jgi:hypothetical protein